MRMQRFVMKIANGILIQTYAVHFIIQKW